MSEATFRPDLEKSRRSALRAGLSTALGHAERGHIVQLMQYVSDTGTPAVRSGNRPLAARTS